MHDEIDLAEQLSSLPDPRGRQEFLGHVFTQYRARLRQMVSLRLFPWLQGKVDPSDVVQEAYLKAAHRLEEYVAKKPMPLYIWLRFLARQCLSDLAGRIGPPPGVGGNGALDSPVIPGQSSVISLAELIASKSLSPPDAAEKTELTLHVQQALEELSPIDREILCLRHFEELKLVDAALELAISAATARKRYFYAIRRFNKALELRLGKNFKDLL